MIPVLFVRNNSIYKTLGVDCWDIKRDAIKFKGKVPAIYHPPCRAWGRLRWNAKPRPGERWLAIWSILMIRKYGGVLEHPATSILFKTMNLPLGNQVDSYGGFSLCVDQSWFGHKAKKKTLLYIVGIKPSEVPDYSLNYNAIEYAICRNVKRSNNTILLKEVSKAEREETPLLFAEFLIKIAKKCKSI